MADQPSITCPVCAMTSYHPKDIETGYCGNCHEFTTLIVPAEEFDRLVAELARPARALPRLRALLRRTEVHDDDTPLHDDDTPLQGGGDQGSLD